MDPHKLFENYFDDADITTTRLVAFGVDHLNRMVQATPAPPAASPYAGMISGITGLLAGMGVVLSGIEGRLRMREGLTQTADEVMSSLREFMKDHEDELRFRLRAVPGAILEFYPQNSRNAYTSLSKERMPVLTGALAAAAARHSATIGSPLDTDLAAFAPRWQAASDAQEQAMGGISGVREQRDLLRPQLEALLMRQVHEIANLFPGDAPGAMALFNFPLLWYRGIRRRHDGGEGDAGNAQGAG